MGKLVVNRVLLSNSAVLIDVLFGIRLLVFWGSSLPFFRNRPVVRGVEWI